MRETNREINGESLCFSRGGYTHTKANKQRLEPKDPTERSVTPRKPINSFMATAYASVALSEPLRPSMLREIATAMMHSLCRRSIRRLYVNYVLYLLLKKIGAFSYDSFFFLGLDGVFLVAFWIWEVGLVVEDIGCVGAVAFIIVEV